MASRQKTSKIPQLFLLGLIAGAVAMFLFQRASLESTTPEIPSIADPRLVQAAEQLDLDGVRSMLAAAIDVNSRAGDGASALHWAAFYDDLELAMALIEAGADSNSSNDLGVVPLWLAAENGSEAMVAALLAADASPNQALPSGETVLMMAARTGNPAVLALLLEHGADISAVESEQNQNALMWAVAQQHSEAVQILLKNGADLNARTSSWVEVAQPAGARPAMRDSLYEIVQGGFTAFLFAAQQGNIEIAELLLEAGVDIEERAANGTTALLIATHSGNSELAQFLLQKGADANARDAGYSALHLAIPHEDLALVNALVEHGANVNEMVVSPTPARRSSRDFAIRVQLVGTSPYWIAAQYRQTEIMKALLAAGADSSFTTDNQDTTLMLAIDGRAAFFDEKTRGIEDSTDGERRALELIEYSLDIGVDINARNRAGDTGLHKAASRGFDTIVQYLAANGADVDAVNERGMTPLDYAMRPRVRGIGQSAVGNKSTEELLRSLGATD